MKGVILQTLLVNVVPAVLELPPCKGVTLDGGPLLQQLQVCSLKAVVPAPAIDHDISLQSLEGSVEGLNLQTLRHLSQQVCWAGCATCAGYKGVLHT